MHSKNALQINPNSSTSSKSETRDLLIKCLSNIALLTMTQALESENPNTEHKKRCFSTCKLYVVMACD